MKNTMIEQHVIFVFYNANKNEIFLWFPSTVRFSIKFRRKCGSIESFHIEADYNFNNNHIFYIGQL